MHHAEIYSPSPILSRDAAKVAKNAGRKRLLMLSLEEITEMVYYIPYMRRGHTAALTGGNFMADKNFLTDIIDADLAEGKIRESIPASHPSPTAICTSAVPRPSTSTGPLPTSTAASSTCVWMTPTPPAKARSTSTASSRTCTGWVPTPTAASSTAATTLTSVTSTPKSSSKRARPM